MSKSWDAIVVSDVQAPFHDPRAFKCFLQIGKKVKPRKLVINGDWLDFATLSSYMKNLRRSDLLEHLDEELEVGRTLLRETIETLNPEEIYWIDGNHEWRLERVIAQDGQMTSRLKQIFNLPEIKDKLTIPALMRLDEYGKRFKGYETYPHGIFLHGSIHKADDVWIEHGYMSGVGAGLLARKMLDKRMCSVIVGHGEKMALLWKKAVGYRELFAIENGNLSKLAEPTGKDHYAGVPHAASEYMDHRQGFSVIHYDGRWWPQTVAIVDGKARFDSVTYKG